MTEARSVDSGRRRRSGGREARRELRSQPLTRDAAPVRGGLAGGQFRALDDAAMAKINGAVLQILE
ncbi:MAG: methyltransferase, partial [Hyphomicrobiaceae bacterium]